VRSASREGLSAGLPATATVGDHPGATLELTLSGDWRVGGAVPDASQVLAKAWQLQGVERVRLDGAEVRSWDAVLLSFVRKAERICQDKGISIDLSGLPEGAQRLMRLAHAVPERQGARRASTRTPLVARTGEAVLAGASAARDWVTFLGEALLAYGRFFLGHGRFQWRDFWTIVQESGAQALPIVSLIAFLIGLILAFVGAVQLRQFGAQIYVADLVGIAMVREMGAVMTAIVMAGRTGAAFAAQLGTMQVNQEIDALSTFGVPSIDFLVFPRLLALTLMMPLLALYADFVGMLGGLVIGIGMLDLGLIQYIEQTRNAVDLTNVTIGVAKAIVFGILVALAGCRAGIRCGRSASAVGEATTSAVVNSIVMIIVCDAVFAVLLEVLGI
jgi:phospholipid/cholesterol/gamma-HCH transport system permease protein